MKKNSFSAALICRKNGEGGIEFLIIPSFRVKFSRERIRTRFGAVLHKFPGGKSHPTAKESPWKTCRREIKEETGLTVYKGVRIEPIETEPGHFQYYFLVYIDSTRGKIRTKTKKDKSSDLLKPIWMKEGELLHSMLLPSHRKALLLFREVGLI